jgi:hypothetical protein
VSTTTASSSSSSSSSFDLTGVLLGEGDALEASASLEGLDGG